MSGTGTELAFVCLTHDRGLKFRDVISARRYYSSLFTIRIPRKISRFAIWPTREQNSGLMTRDLAYESSSHSGTYEKKNCCGKLVDFRKTSFHDSARQSEAASTNKKNGGTSGRTMWS